MGLLLGRTIALGRWLNRRRRLRKTVVQPTTRLPGVAAAAPAPGPAQHSRPSSSNAVLRAAADENFPGEDTFVVQIKSGSGDIFEQIVHGNLTVDDLHRRISSTLGAANCPMYAIRLIHKKRVLSIRPEEILSAFGVAQGDTLLLVIVRDGAAPKVTEPSTATPAPATQGSAFSAFVHRRANSDEDDG